MSMVAMGLATMLMETHYVGARGDEWSLSPVGRFLLAGRALWFYAGKLVWPQPIVFFYPRFSIDERVWWQYLFPAAALVLMLGLWLARKRIGRGPLAAVLVFAGVLVPALGFFNVYYMRYAYVSDHFQYHASLALIALAAAAATLFAARLQAQWRGAAKFLAVAALAVLAALTFQQTRIYANLETLYRDTIAKNPAAWIAYLNLSAHFDALGRDKEAMELAREALRINPKEPRVHTSMGNLLLKFGDRDGNQELRRQAREQYQTAVELNPGYADAYIALGFMAVGERSREGARYFAKALDLVPREPHALHGMGAMLGLEGKWAEAQEYLEKAVASDPRYADGHYDLAIALMNQGQTSQAIEHLRSTLDLNPNRADAHYNLGNLLVSQNDLRRAALHYEQAARLQPGYVEALTNLGAALLKLGEVDQALPHCAEALRLAPDNPQVRANLEQAQLLKQQQTNN
jgi:tetratricopeptide (TPR) repeat protein